MKTQEIKIPKFSVSMSVYKEDKVHYFKQALDSVINQTVSPTELILVIDGPVSAEIKNLIVDYQEYLDTFHPIWLKKNVGHGEARRIGILRCNYELIALMDSDDICRLDRFEKQLACFMEDRNLSVTGGQIQEFIDSTNNTVGIRKVYLSDDKIKQQTKSRCPMNQMTVMFKKTDVLAAGGYIDWYCNEDYYLWVRMILKGFKFKNIEDILVDVRVGKDMYRRRGGFEYFKSEAKLQKYMYDNGLISGSQFIANISIRFLLQVIFPNKLRGFIFQKLLRQ